MVVLEKRVVFPIWILVNQHVLLNLMHNLIFQQSTDNPEISDLWLINALAIKLPSNLINTFSNQPQVDHIDLDAVITLSEHTVVTSNSPPTWNTS